MSALGLKWGILGTGRIASALANGIRLSQSGELIATGSRHISTALEFTEKFGGKAYDSYMAVLNDPEVDVVYISLPHSLHEEWTIRCAKAGKGVLCEKPFTLDFDGAQRAIDACREANVFFAEAFMYRMHPQTEQLQKLVQSGVIGEVNHIHAEFGFYVDESWTEFRGQRREGGGGLMDVGTYCVSMIRLLMESEPNRCEFGFKPAGDGYDASGAGLMVFEGGRTATFSSGVHLEMENHVRIYGSKGRIEVDSPWMCRGSIWVQKQGQNEREEIAVERVTDLYANEVDRVAQFWANGEMPHMTIDDSLNNMKCLDELRKSAGLSFI